MTRSRVHPINHNRSGRDYVGNLRVAWAEDEYTVTMTLHTVTTVVEDVTKVGPELNRKVLFAASKQFRNTTFEQLDQRWTSDWPADRLLIAIDQMHYERES